MGNLILCSGKKAENPFHFQLTETNIYTIEELCYYIYSNIYVMGDELYQLSLAEWLINEVDMIDIGEKLKQLIGKNHSLKDIVVSILCSADYYTEKEIKDLIRLMDEIALLSPIRRMKLKADKYISYRNYHEAISLYHDILENKEAAVFTEEEYGNIMHNMAIAFLYTSSYHEAAEYFKAAYQRNSKEESLKQYLFTLRFGDNNEELEKAIRDYNVSEEFVHEIYQEIKSAKEKAEESPAYHEIIKLKELKNSGQVNDYYQKINWVLKELKREYRK